MLDTLQNFLDVAKEPLGDLPAFAHAQTIAERAADRLRFPRQFTTIALTGTTGSGKSSMFNAFTTIDRSPAGILRPTTSEPYACVWGTLTQADELLDWLGVSSRRRFTRESALDANDEAGLRGMILLDLPDVDSIEPRHRVEVDRLLHLVDVVVWICDPQKYADQLMDGGYLRQLASHRAGLVVALNQTDKLLPAHLPKVGADLRQLLDEAGLKKVPLVATSATGVVPEPPATKRSPVKPKPGPFSTEKSANGYPGVASLRARLEPLIVSGKASSETVGHDLAAALQDMSILVGGPAAPTPAAGPLVDALVRKDIDHGVRSYASSAAKGLPEAWQEAVLRTAQSRLNELPAALDQAAERAEANRPRRVWIPGGRKRADARAEVLLQQEVDKVALRYVIEPVRRTLANYDRARIALS
jgi:GTP-binding protein EngB required for normal cell division